MDSELTATLLLQRLPDFGAGSYWKLRRRFPGAMTVLSTPVQVLANFLSPDAQLLLREYQATQRGLLAEQLQADMEWLDQHSDVHLIHYDDDNYPTLLRTIDQPPPLLFVRGAVENLSLPQLAIVGSRNPTATGRDNAVDFAHELAQTGFVITSGMALGIDAAAHCGAMQANGRTIAVFGAGIDRIYPQSHRRLAEDIVANGGTLVSEFPIGTAPNKQHFPRRNRIISGMSLGVLVVEAALRSGSLITAKYAVQQGREVFAIPGSIHNPLSRGCHTIIRDGAMLVERVSDMHEPLQGLLALKWQECKDKDEAEPAPQPELTALSKEETLVYQALGFEPTPIEKLEQRTQLDIGNLLSCLIALELHGLAQQADAGYQRLVPSRASTPINA